MTDWSSLFRKKQQVVGTYKERCPSTSVQFIEEGLSLSGRLCVSTISVVILPTSDLPETLCSLACAAILRLSGSSEIEVHEAAAASLFERKNQDYGDAFATYGLVGIIVRLGDKFARFNSLVSSGDPPQVTGESIDDTLVDIYNYCIMALMLLTVHESGLQCESNVDALLQERDKEESAARSCQLAANQHRTLVGEINDELESVCPHKWVRRADVFCDGATPHICSVCGLKD